MTDTTTPNATPASDTLPAPVDPHAQMWRDHAAAELRAGKLTAEQHAGILAELFPQETPAPAITPDPDAQGLAQIGFPPAREMDVKLPPIVGEDGTQHKEAEAAIRGWGLASALPAPILNSVISNATAYLQRVEGMNAGQRDVNQALERAKLERHFGADTEARLADAKMAAAAIERKKPGFLHFLQETGLGDSHALIVQLSLHGARLKEIRNGKR